MSKLAAIKRILTLTCDESTRLVSQSLDAELPRGERLAVRLHVLCCRPCRQFSRQMRLLRTLLRGDGPAPASTAFPTSPSLSPEARQRLHQALSQIDNPESS